VERVLVFVLLLLLVGVAALVLSRRRPEAPTQPRYQVPAQLDRADFDQPDKPWLVALFTSATCDSCEKVRPKAMALASSHVVVQEVEYSQRKDLHERYSIEVVPLILIAGPDGAVSGSFIGTPSATDLWAAVAEAREPGASPEPDLGR
jgi:hypothetical protein